MKINNKGFTLIELLAVVVLLLAITVIAVSSISAAIERNKVKQDNAKKEIIISYAQLYYQEHKNSLPVTGCINIPTLNLDVSEITDSNGEEFSGVIKYTNGSNFVYADEC